MQVVTISRPAALLAQQLQKDGVTSEQIIGPLLMEIDVPNPSQRLLVEQALSTKQLTCFLARTDGRSRAREGGRTHGQAR